MTEDAAAPAGFELVTAVVAERLARNERVRRNLPGGGRVRIDRQLPFLCVYRSPPGRDDPGTRDLVTTEAAYAFAPGSPEHHAGLAGLCRTIAAVASEHFGTFLLIELWSEEGPPLRPLDRSRFRIVTTEPDAFPALIEALTAALTDVSVNGLAPEVTVTACERVAPPGLEPLLPSGPASGGTVALGLAVRPVYRDPTSATLFPVVLQSLRRRLAVVLRKAVFAFSGASFSGAAGVDPHYESLGPTALTRAARLTDRQLCDVASSFDFLLQVTPTNADEAWEEFRDGGYSKEPTFRYRPLPYHPRLLKRRLFDVPLDRIEDATLAQLCGEKQDELDLQLSALRDLGTDRFLYGSLQLYGGADDPLVRLAEELLRLLPTSATAEAAPSVSAATVADAARREIEHYRIAMPDFDAAVEVRDDVAAGLMVVQDRLHISGTLILRRDRVAPLLHHEVGTHLLTYFNGRRQPFGLLSAGLAGYDPLQEGLAVLAEYLAGGLTATRLRTLAGRVLAVRARTDGVSFAEAFRLLRDGYGFPARSAFTTVLRAYRGGGLTKDAIYLRGFRDLLEYLRCGHDVEPLYVGKIGLHHVPYVRELRRRGVLGPPGALPRLWEDPDLRERLDACRRSGVLELAETAR